MKCGTKELIVETVDGEEIHRGTVKSASALFGMSEDRIRTAIYTNGGQYKGFVFTYAKKDDTLEYLVRHLTEYDNTVLGMLKEKTVVKYIAQLKELGINATYRKVKEKEDRRAWYVLERRNNVQSETTLYGLPGNR